MTSPMELELHFDILCDLVRDLLLVDHFAFLSINELSYEINKDMEGVMKRVEYYYRTWNKTKWSYITSIVCLDGDLGVLKWIYYRKREVKTNLSLHFASLSGNEEMVKWLQDNDGDPK